MHATCGVGFVEGGENAFAHPRPQRGGGAFEGCDLTKDDAIGRDTILCHGVEWQADRKRGCCDKLQVHGYSLVL